MERKKLEEVILKSTTLTPLQTREILDSKTHQGPSLSDQLSSGRGNLNAEQALSRICKHLNLRFLAEIPSGDIPLDLISGIPIHYAKTHSILPLKEEEDKVQVLTSNPFSLKVFNNLELQFGKQVEPVVSLNHKIQESINHVYEKNTQDFAEFKDIQVEDYNLNDPVIDLLEADDEAPVINLVNTLLVRAVKERASDIHVEPYEREVVIRFRVDGALYSVLKVPKRLQNTLSSRIKIMGKLNIAEKRLPQDGSIPLRLAGKDIDIRLNTIPTAFGERLVMRLQDRSQTILKINQLGFAEESVKTLSALLEKSYGIILATGPTGSGKSFTLYASLAHIQSTDTNIITLENPVEQRIQGIGQIQVNPKVGLTFANGFRAILRQDPDVIMVGEIRDSETMKIAINASLTGHLVLSTIHTNDSAGVFPRLIDMGCEPFLIATSLLGVISQRLVRLLCPHCKKPYKMSQKEKDILKLSPPKNATLFKPEGCGECNYKGYAGRTAIEEILTVNDNIRIQILQRASGSAIKKVALEQGLVTFRDHGLQKAFAGQTTIEEVLANTQLDL